MNRTKIEWTDFTWNPVTGCLHGCPYCYARRLAKGLLKHRYNGFKPTFWPERLHEPYKLKKPSKIFVCSMADLFGSWVPQNWVWKIFRVIWDLPHHQFQILTKAPNNIHAFFPWPTSTSLERYQGKHLPNNLWLGTTVEHQGAIWRIRWIADPGVSHQGPRFISFEPLIGPVYPVLHDIDWIIIGAQTGPGAKPPKPEWVESIIKKADYLDIPVFLKDNLGEIKEMLGDRQEFPEPEVEA